MAKFELTIQEQNNHMKTVIMDGNLKEALKAYETAIKTDCKRAYLYKITGGAKTTLKRNYFQAKVQKINNAFLLLCAWHSKEIAYTFCDEMVLNDIMHITVEFSDSGNYRMQTKGSKKVHLETPVLDYPSLGIVLNDGTILRVTAETFS